MNSHTHVKTEKYLFNVGLFAGLSFLIFAAQRALINISKFTDYYQNYSVWESIRKTFFFDFSFSQYQSEVLSFWSGMHVAMAFALLLFAQLAEKVIENSLQDRPIQVMERVALWISILLSIATLVLLGIRYINFGSGFTIYGSYLSFSRYVCEFLAILFLIPYCFAALVSQKKYNLVGMFKSSSNIIFKTSKPFNEVLELLEDELAAVGSVEITQDKSINIDASKYNGFLTKSSVTGTIRQKEEKFNVSIEHNSTLSTWGWIILVIGFFVYGLGLLVLLGPGLTRGELKGKVERALANVKFQF